jgi:hypothetical protein
MQNYNSKFKILTFYIVMFIFVFSIFNFAQAGVIPCGLSKDDPNQPGDQTIPCTYCHLLQLVKNVIDFMMYLIFPIATGVIIYGGFVILTARESAEQVSKGRKIITAAVVGILIALISWLALDTIFKILASISGTEQGAGPAIIKGIGRPWSQLNCQ